MNVRIEQEVLLLVSCGVFTRGSIISRGIFSRGLLVVPPESGHVGELSSFYSVCPTFQLEWNTSRHSSTDI